MNTKGLLQKIKNKKVVLLPVTELDVLLNSVEVLLEKDTIVNGKVRILKLNGEFLFQEITAKDELALRKLSSLKEAQKLIDDRLAIYENMWNGCGCKVNYYE